MSEIPVVGQRLIPPDPNTFEALASFGYTLEEAIADLVDNSIDAEAQEVLVRIETFNGRPQSLIVVDNGHGIPDHRMDVAMKVGGRREYGDRELGMFGLGLKSASFAQAGQVALMSRASGRRATGRMWVPERARQNWACDVIDPVYAKEILDQDWSPLRLRPSGTIVRWDQVRDFQRATNDPHRYVDTVLGRIRKHLGLQLHRFLQERRVRIQLDVFDIRTGELSLPSMVDPLDPFSYPVSGRRGYPKAFSMNTEDYGIIPFAAHIWPPNSKLAGYRLGGGQVSSRQGFYFYRNRRLVQGGGWNGFRDNEPHLSLARLEIDLEPPYDRLFRLTVKKSGVEVPQSFLDSLRVAFAEDGTSFKKFLDDAEATYRRERNKTKGGVRRLSLGRGLPAAVVRTAEEALQSQAGYPVDFSWVRLEDEQLFALDRQEGRIMLNNKYRPTLLAGRRGTGVDLPTIKSMLFLLLEPHLRSGRVSQGQSDELEAWQSILVSALRAEAR